MIVRLPILRLDVSLTFLQIAHCLLRLVGYATLWHLLRLIFVRYAARYSDNGILLMKHLGLGEITFLQLITRYNPPSLMGHCVGYTIYRDN